MYIQPRNNHWFAWLMGVLLMLALSSANAGTIIVRVDTPCDLKVDGRLEYSYDEWLINYPVLLSPGSHVIECVSKKAPRTKASKVVVVEDETSDMVTLRLKVSKRWKQDGEHLIDLQTNLRWTAQDNGIGLSWPQAQRYCQQLGDDWRLPTTAELLGIFDTTEIGIECPSST